MNKPEEFEKNAKNLLDESLDDLSPEITRRLQQARYEALEKAKPRSSWSFFPQSASDVLSIPAVPAISAVFAVAIISATLMFSFNENKLNKIELAMEADIEVLTANESLDLLEDLEFMEWLAESEEYAS